MKNPFKRRKRKTPRLPNMVTHGMLGLALVITIILGALLYFEWVDERSLGALIGGLFPAFIAGKIFRDYWRSKSCLTILDMSSRTGIPEKELKTMLDAKKIVPSYFVQSSGKEFVPKYVLEDLGEMMSLLRASEQPQNHATLLHPVQENPTAPEMLLRPIETERTETKQVVTRPTKAERTELQSTERQTAAEEEKQLPLRN